MADLDTRETSETQHSLKTIRFVISLHVYNEGLWPFNTCTKASDSLHLSLYQVCLNE